MNCVVRSGVLPLPEPANWRGWVIGEHSDVLVVFRQVQVGGKSPPELL